MLIRSSAAAVPVSQILRRIRMKEMALDPVLQGPIVTGARQRNFRDVGGTVVGFSGAVRRNTLYCSNVHVQAPISNLGWQPGTIVEVTSDRDVVATPGQDECCRDIVERDAATFVDLIVRVATAEFPVLVHCAEGPGPTELAIALILDLLGVRADLIIMQSSASSSSYEIAEAMSVWRSHAGGVEGWLVAHGLTPEHIRRLRNRLVWTFS